ncbi:MAG: ExeA family protein [Vibrio sp.]
MYLAHFELKQFPFQLTPDTSLFLALPSHYEALQLVSSALDMGEGIVKITGEVGTGKTMVCRMLLAHLAEQYTLLYLPNPALSRRELRRAIASELQLPELESEDLVEHIHNKLLSLHHANKRIVVLVDEAQALPDDALEGLRLFGNLETEHEKLLHMVLIGQPELDERLTQHHLRQLRQRITFNAHLRPLTFSETVAYIDSRLTSCGGSSSLFTLQQKQAMWRAARGIPRVINQIGQKALLLSFYKQRLSVDNASVFSAIHDCSDACKPKFKMPLFWGWSK